VHSRWPVVRLDAGRADGRPPGRHLGGVQSDHPSDVLHHPIRAAAHEAAHLRAIAAAGESPLTPAILVGLVLAFVVPLAAILMLLAFGIADFS
jgi:hypothetical protein